MNYRLLTLGAVALAAVAIAADPPKLGPEWTYDKEMKEYKKTMPIKVTRPSAGLSGQGYHLDLQHDKVVVNDTDDNIATEVRVNDTMSLYIRKEAKGGPGRVTVVVNKCAYTDLDGDGVWDAMGDGRAASSKFFIRRDGEWVQVCDSKGGVGDGPALSADRKTEYTWDGKAWTSRAVNR
jgi:hypothetical protein